LDGLFVATDDDRIRKAAEKTGVEVIMTRADHVSGTDRVAEAASLLGRDVEGVMNIQGDEPLIDPCLIDEHVKVMISKPCWDVVTAASPLASAEEARNPAVCKVVFGSDGAALYFSRSVIPFTRDGDFQSGEPLYWRHIGVYLYRTAFLARMVAEPPCLLERTEKLEQLRALHIGGRIKVIRSSCAGPGVDVPDDVHAVEIEMKRLGWA